MKIINLEIKEAQLTKRARNMKKTSPIHVIIKLFRTDNKNILKVVREKNPINNVSRIQLGNTSKVLKK